MRRVYRPVLIQFRREERGVPATRGEGSVGRGEDDITERGG